MMINGSGKMTIKFNSTPIYHTKQHKITIRFSSTPNYHTKQHKMTNSAAHQFTTQNSTK
jgi:hypothetical protein